MTPASTAFLPLTIKQKHKQTKTNKNAGNVGNVRKLKVLVMPPASRLLKHLLKFAETSLYQTPLPAGLLS